MKKIGILIENYFDEQEFIYPYHRLRESYEVVVIGSSPESKYHSKQGFVFQSDLGSSQVNPSDLDGLFIPGGFAPDYMRTNKDTKELVKALNKSNKPIAAICHGPWLLASSLDIKGKQMTSVTNIKDDIKNAGANWIDEETVIDGNLITARSPEDLPSIIKAFTNKIEEE